MRVETLEDRSLLTAVPFGASSQDTAEYLLGDVLVNVVLMESNGDVNTEDWTGEQIADVKDKVQEGYNWWTETLDQNFPGHKHSLNFQFDFTHADTPFLSSYEPIERISDDFLLWGGEFLAAMGHPVENDDFTHSIREYNHQLRVEHETNWAFTVFVVDNDQDEDTLFKSGGSFRNAFAFPGGQFIIAQASRPASTHAHEMGHIFYAFDEYSNGTSHSARRGYLDAQNTNGLNGNPNPGSSVDSIMKSTVSEVYDNHLISSSAMALMGWQDSDGDGVFDILDVPHKLSGSGWLDGETGKYRFVGHSSVDTLHNDNPSAVSYDNDITINRLSRAQYRIDGGQWLTAQTIDDYTADLDLTIDVPAGQHTIEIRTIDDATGVTSNVFQASAAGASSTSEPGIHGFLWRDTNQNGVRDADESGLPNVSVELHDPQGNLINRTETIEPDDFDSLETLNDVSPFVELTARGTGLNDESVFARMRDDGASTGDMVFGHVIGFTQFSTEWTGNLRQLAMSFPSPVSLVSLDAVANSDLDIGRLEIYNAAGEMLGAINSQSLSAGQSQTLQLARSEGDIALAVAYGDNGTAVRFDNLQFSFPSAAVTDAGGGYRFTDLSAGTYVVTPSVPTGTLKTSPVSGAQGVNLSAGQVKQNVNFGLVPPVLKQHNAAFPEDVNDSGDVGTADVLEVIRDIREHGIRDITDEAASGPPFVDVDGNNTVSINDALQVIRLLRSQINNAEPATGGAAESEMAPPQGTEAEPILIMPQTLEPSPASVAEQRWQNEETIATGAESDVAPFSSPSNLVVPGGETALSAIASECASESELEQTLDDIALDIALASDQLAKMR